jgi:hypothetical protein
VLLLRDEIHRLGGEPSTSGPWGESRPEISAERRSTKAAIAVLEQDEDHRRDDYHRGLRDLTPTTRNFVVARLLPEQQRTAETVRALEPA